jgi:hypothetical protein
LNTNGVPFGGAPPALPGAIDIQALTGLNKIMPKVNVVTLFKMHAVV